MSPALDIKFPKISYNKNDQDLYTELVLEEWSPFKEHTRAEVFIFAMAYAFNKKLEPLDLESSKLELPGNAFDDNMRNLMRSLAISVKKDVNIIKDNHAVLDICEMYANTALKKIYKTIKEKNPEISSENVLESLIQN